MSTPNPVGNPAWTKGGPSPNPGGRPKHIKRLLELFGGEVTPSLALLVRVRDDVGEETRVRVEAAKFICLYGLGTPPKADFDEDNDTTRLPDGLTLDEVRALARRPLSTELTGNAVPDKQPA